MVGDAALKAVTLIDDELNSIVVSREVSPCVDVGTAAGVAEAEIPFGISAVGAIEGGVLDAVHIEVRVGEFVFEYFHVFSPGSCAGSSGGVVC